MTQTPPPTSRRSARAAAPQRRVSPHVRPLVEQDFFGWVDLYAASLEQLGAEFRDVVALRTWRELGFANGTPGTAGMECIVAERAGSLAGFAISAPAFTLTTGEPRLDVLALSVPRLNDDGPALEALIEALHERAQTLGALELRWSVPVNAIDMVQLSGRIGEVTPLAVYRMPTA